MGREIIDAYLDENPHLIFNAYIPGVEVVPEELRRFLGFRFAQAMQLELAEYAKEHGFALELQNFLQNYLDDYPRNSDGSDVASEAKVPS